ncbi:MAG: hypothetical protein IJK36_06135 [Bacteroidales bacterium]|nr:hypothetical protein [Bacteroidales bacterium]
MISLFCYWLLALGLWQFLYLQEIADQVRNDTFMDGLPEARGQKPEATLH